MATIKSFTDISQSKTLSKILPIESADMCYKCIGEDPYDVVLRPYSEWKEEYKGLLVRGDANVIPCWSLSALLNVIPKRIKEYNILRIDIGEKDFAIWYDEVGFGVNNDLPDIIADNPVDACYEMIMNLKCCDYGL